MNYDVGDVVLVHFPYYKEGELIKKVRPAIIQKINSDDESIIIQITTNNRSDKKKGLWILKSSKRGKELGILSNSFINVSNTALVNKYALIKPIGHCSFMDEIYELQK